MDNPFEPEEEEWVEICDASGKRAAMRHLATLSVSGKTYFVLGSVSQEEDRPEGLLLVREDEDLMVITDDGTIIRLPVESISVLSRNTQGVRVMRVAEGSRIVGVKQTDREDESAEEAPEE